MRRRSNPVGLSLFRLLLVFLLGRQDGWFIGRSENAESESENENEKCSSDEHVAI